MSFNAAMLSRPQRCVTVSSPSFSRCSVSAANGPLRSSAKSDGREGGKDECIGERSDGGACSKICTGSESDYSENEKASSKKRDCGRDGQSLAMRFITRCLAVQKRSELDTEK